jgi:undecaprenyl-diphosphatase
LVAISRVYLGLHYPSDILGGAVIGSAFGYIFAFTALRIEEFFNAKTGKELSNK